MKKFLFICDFDGTITEIDFYKIIMDKYMYEPGSAKLKELRSGVISILEFLSYIFNNINQEEHVIDKDIRNMKFRAGFIDFVEFIEKNGGEVLILSAGLDYYIKKAIKYKNLNNIKIYANKSHFKEKGLYHIIDESWTFYCSNHGINKKKVVEALRDKYEIICYAGDGYPDFEPAKLCDRIFTTSRLTELCTENNIPQNPFIDFYDIKSALEREKNLF